MIKRNVVVRRVIYLCGYGEINWCNLNNILKFDDDIENNM